MNKQENIKTKVLNKGEVELIDYMGNDFSILRSARVSTGGEAQKGDKQDRGLIRYLYKNQHMSPFEQSVFTFRIKAPHFVVKQLLRHRTFSFNEFSARYSEALDEVYIPDVWRKQGEKNHQGSGELFDEIESREFSLIAEELYAQIFEKYNYLISKGVSRELARTIIPVSNFSIVYATVDLRNLLHFLELRMHNHAQEEIREYAFAMYSIIRNLEEFKWTLEIFEEETFSKEGYEDVEDYLKEVRYVK